jgi:RNase adaptor protein for sRNA GlmZ degradation
MPSINHISAVYVTGIAGSGKSSSVIQMGLKLAVEILEDSGYMNTAVLPVATFESQIEIVSKSVGKLSKGMEGMSVDNLHKMLKLAVIEQDEDAIATLSAIGIAIDEATYVQAVTVNDDMVELEY